MKKVYWRPHRVSRPELILIAVLAVGSMLAVERLKRNRQQPHFAEKIAAAKLARRAFDTIRAERIRRRIPIDPKADPAETGLIGELMTLTTTTTGNLFAKQTTINPNFAAVVVEYLKRAGVNAGDTVAVGVSGSLPGMNIATYAALQSIGAKPIAIASASGSQWGANHPDFLWLDMERVLQRKGVFTTRVVAASRGGIEDRAVGLSETSQRLLDTAMRRNKVNPIVSKDFNDAVDIRMRIYREQAGAEPIKAYVNVGGGTVSVGTHVGKKIYHEGLNRRLPAGAGSINSVMARFSAEGVPVIHLVNVIRIAERFGLPVQPKVTPAIGSGKIFAKRDYNVFLALGSIGLISLTMFALIRLDWGVRIFQSKAPPVKKPPEQMV